MRNIYCENFTYNIICKMLEKEGWTKETTFINEKMGYTSSLNSAKAGETSLIIEIKCPADLKILIRGTENGDINNFKDAYPIKLSLFSKSKNEISQLTKIRITKEKITEEKITKEKTSIDSIRCFYTDISKNDDDHLYRPRKNILLQEGEHLYTYIIGENIGLKLPDIAIDKGNISFLIKADIFTFKGSKYE